MSLNVRTSFPTSATTLAQHMGIMREELINFPYFTVLREIISDINYGVNADNCIKRLEELIEKSKNERELSIYVTGLEKLKGTVIYS